MAEFSQSPTILCVGGPDKLEQQVAGRCSRTAPLPRAATRSDRHSKAERAAFAEHSGAVDVHGPSIEEWKQHAVNDTNRSTTDEQQSFIEQGAADHKNTSRTSPSAGTSVADDTPHTFS